MQVLQGAEFKSGKSLELYILATLSPMFAKVYLSDSADKTA